MDIIKRTILGNCARFILWDQGLLRSWMLHKTKDMMPLLVYLLGMLILQKKSTPQAAEVKWLIFG